MPITTPSAVFDPAAPVVHAGPAPASAVSWAAILAGAAAAAALSLILLILGIGLGLSAVSPWAFSGISAGTFGVSTILWITLTSLAASALGGYVAGRLRTRWAATPLDEVYFRDTAHGFLAWCIATLLTAGLLTTTVGAIVNGGVQAGAQLAKGAAAVAGGTAAAAGGAMAGTEGDGPTAYYVDSLFRRDAASSPAAQVLTDPSDPTATTTEQPSRGNFNPWPGARGMDTEVARIYANAASLGALPEDDVRHLGQIIAQRTGLSQTEAEARVRDNYQRLQQAISDAETKVKQAADEARKATAKASLWLFISLLGGAFIASLSATYGGRQRDL